MERFFTDDAIAKWIEIFPSILWVIFAVIIFCLFYKRIRDELLPNLTGFKAMGVQFSFVKSSITAAIELGQEWGVSVPKKDKDVVLSRIRKQMHIFNNAKILWLDDLPANNRHERRMLRRLQTRVDIATNSKNALEMLRIDIYDLVISDIAREDEQDLNGLLFLEKLRGRNDGTAVIFYVGDYDSNLGVPEHAFGITDRPDQLLHLILDALE